MAICVPDDPYSYSFAIPPSNLCYNERDLPVRTSVSTNDDYVNRMNDSKEDISPIVWKQHATI